MENSLIPRGGSWRTLTQVTWVLLVCAACDAKPDREFETATAAAGKMATDDASPEPETADTPEAEPANAGGDAAPPVFGCSCRWGCFPDRDQPSLGETWVIGECETVTTNDGEAVDSPSIGTMQNTQAEAADYCNTFVYDPLRDTGRILIALLPEVHSCVPLE